MARLGVAALTPAVLVDKLTEDEKHPFWLLVERLRNDLLLRDLGAGAWSEVVAKGCRKDVEVLLTHLQKSGRIASAVDAIPKNDHSYRTWDSDKWLQFGHQSHQLVALDALIRRGARGRDDKPPEVPLAEFGDSPWVNRCAARGTLTRTASAIGEELSPFFRHAKYVAIFDPALDPSSPDYQYLNSVISSAVAGRRTPLRLTINRPCYELIGGKRSVPKDWAARFSSWQSFGKKRVIIRVRIWSDLHDRLVQSNLGGLHFGNGLAATSRGKPMSFSWHLREQAQDAARGAVEGEKVQTEFTFPDSKDEVWE